MTILYVLKLRDNCYYVGTTQNLITNRVKMHLSGLATKWTRIHKPVALVKQINCMNSINPRIQEDMHVKQLMLEHGIDNVRGGSCTKCQLGPVEMKALRRELWNARNC